MFTCPFLYFRAYQLNTKFKIFMFFSVCEWAEFNKSCNLIGSGGGRIFPSRPLSAGGIDFIKIFEFCLEPFKRPLLLRKYVSKNHSVKPLSSTWIISVFITICLLEIVQFVTNLAMITALTCSGLSHAFRCVVEKINLLFT